MSHCAQVSEDRLEWNDFYARVYEHQVPVIRELTKLAEGQSPIVKQTCKLDPPEWKRAAYELIGEKLHILEDTLPIQDIQKLRPSLPEELEVLLQQLIEYENQASLFQSFLHFLTNPAGVPPFFSF